MVETHYYQSITDYVELEEDKQYNRYFQRTSEIDVTTDIRKIISFGDVSLVYTNETLDEVINKWRIKNKQQNS